MIGMAWFYIFLVLTTSATNLGLKGFDDWCREPRIQTLTFIVVFTWFPSRPRWMALSSSCMEQSKMSSIYVPRFLFFVVIMA